MVGWVKTYQKDKDHLIMIKMAVLVKSHTDMCLDPEEKELRVFDYLLSSWSGPVLEPGKTLRVLRLWTHYE